MSWPKEIAVGIARVLADGHTDRVEIRKQPAFPWGHVRAYVIACLKCGRGRSRSTQREARLDWMRAHGVIR